MTYNSFLKFTKFAMLMGLIEVVREIPMLYPPPRGHLYRVDKPSGKRLRVVISKIRIVALTQNGALEGVAWRDLRRAWQEDWAVPTIAPPEPEPEPELVEVSEAVHELGAAPPTEAVRRPRGRPRKAPRGAVPSREGVTLSGRRIERGERGKPWESYKIKGKPLPQKLKDFLKHLVRLSLVGDEDQTRIRKLTGTPGGIQDLEIGTPVTVWYNPATGIAYRIQMAEPRMVSNAPQGQVMVSGVIEAIGGREVTIGTSKGPIIVTVLPEVAVEVHQLSNSIGDWGLELEDEIADEDEKGRPNYALIQKKIALNEKLEEVGDALSEQRLDDAVRLMGEALGI